MLVSDDPEPRDLGPLAPGFAVILVEPQLGENIGMVVRAMANCALGDLRLVRPRDGWPNPMAVAAASGADRVLNSAKVFQTTGEAVADLQTVLASTARPRDMIKDVFTPREAVKRLRCDVANGINAGVLFGKESSGLNNDDVALASGILTVPLNPVFSSLNLAQAVFVIGYEWLQAADVMPEAKLERPKEKWPANMEEMSGLFEHLERELDTCGFLRVQGKRPIMVRNIRNIFLRACLTEQEVRTLRGVISGLVKPEREPID